MKQTLARLAEQTGLALPDREPLRLAFGHAASVPASASTSAFTVAPAASPSAPAPAPAPAATAP